MQLPETYDLTGRVAVITGAGSPSGIGFATASLLGRLGARLMLGATSGRVLDRVDELCADGLEAAAVMGDLTEQAAAEELVSAAADRFGRVDVVVNNAGMVSASNTDYETGSAEEISLGVWRASLRRNLDTALLVSRAALPLMREAGWGRIVMVASVTGPVMAMRGDVAYAAAKAGMVGLTRALAVDSAADGVTVNAVAPGWIETSSQLPHERCEGLSTPIGRSAAPNEVASAIGWLASPGASYITGQCLVVDGGNSVAEERALPS